MSFGLTGAPATFQHAMNRTLASLLRKCALVFFDDILVYSPTWEAHLSHLELVLQLLSHDSWQVKLSKCKFGQQEIAYLGHVISSAGVATDPGTCRILQKVCASLRIARQTTNCSPQEAFSICLDISTTDSF
jgi:hypothetical protein